MLHELRFYEIAAGRLDDYINHAGKVAVPHRGDNYGKLLGFWACEIGAVNCVFNLWEHESVATREVVRAKLQTMDWWRNDYLPHSQPLMRRQLSRLLMPLADAKPPAVPGNHYEMRIFRTRAGKTSAFAALVQRELPAPLQAATVAVWTGNSGDVNEVVLLSAYADTLSYAQTLQSVAWRGFLKQHGAMVEDIQSSWMTPVAYSPWR
jgi:NIPSNAP